MTDLKWALTGRKQISFICAGIRYIAEPQGMFNDPRSRSFVVSCYILEGPGAGAWRDFRYAHLREMNVLRESFAPRQRHLSVVPL
ncbi:hypothetical protein OJ996_05085 [Luteolibacter sp. GHJ8]|uniref:Uncharacterized protein n=1 Tax=Luteolibacter rhizosphaerae TaxID=2989719 RepID=A0ABT3G126_9BACT|nr:hypothetical protein [Luteolibacter rhizosphaerae]MCW1912935.1 hypothetical protein [Luteolibacter rhizosphaerae]